eukprot:100385-Chlamydomonas_euryale.AAC.22
MGPSSPQPKADRTAATAASLLHAMLRRRPGWALALRRRPRHWRGRRRLHTVPPVQRPSHRGPHAGEYVLVFVDEAAGDGDADGDVRQRACPPVILSCQQRPLLARQTWQLMQWRPSRLIHVAGAAAHSAGR